MSVQDFVRTAASPPDWLQKAWTGAKRRGLDALTLHEVNAEINAHRSEKARGEARCSERSLTPTCSSPACCDIVHSMVKTLELAISRASELPDAVQEQLGRELLEHLDALAQLRAAIDIGVRELDAGQGEPLNLEEVIAQARKEHAAR